MYMSVGEGVRSMFTSHHSSCGTEVFGENSGGNITLYFTQARLA